MGASLCCATKDDQPSDISKFPVELLENVLFFLNYQQISTLRLVNREWNSICSKYLNAAFSNIKTDVESFIRLTSDEEYIKEDANKLLDQVLKSYNRKDKLYANRYIPVVQKIIFVNRKIKILIILRDGIFRNMFYKSSKNLFAYGNMVDWPEEELKFEAYKDEITTSTNTLKLPPQFTKQLDEMVAFYEMRGRDKWPWYNNEFHREIRPNVSYENRKQLVASIAELIFYATTNLIVAAPGNVNPIIYRFDKFDIKTMRLEDDYFNHWLLIIFANKKNLKGYFDDVCDDSFLGIACVYNVEYFSCVLI